MLPSYKIQIQPKTTIIVEDLGSRNKSLGPSDFSKDKDIWLSLWETEPTTEKIELSHII